jgi:hypothetical protein
MSRGRNENVRRFDVPMDDPFGVGGIEPVGDLDGQVEDFISAQRLSPDAMFERVALQELHGDEAPPFVLVDVIDGADVGMVQGRSRLGFTLESLQRVAVSRQLFGQELQGNGAPEAGVLGLVDHTHAAPAELLQDPVVRHGLPDHGKKKDIPYRALKSRNQARRGIPRKIPSALPQRSLLTEAYFRTSFSIYLTAESS